MYLLISKYLKQFKFSFQLLSGYLVGVFLGGLIIRDDPFFLLLSLSIPFGFLLFTYPEIGIYIIMISVFFLDWFKELGLIPAQMTLLPEVILVFLTFKVFLKKIVDREFIRTPIDIPFLLFIILGIISMLINSTGIISLLVGFRFDLKYVFMFYLIVNLKFNEHFFKRLMQVFLTLMLIQVPVAIVKYTIYGQGESAIGTYSAHTGTLSTILPLIAISIFLGFFFFEKPHLRYILYSLLFVLFSIIGGKRAFVFFGTLLFLFIFWQVGRKNLGKFSIVAPFLMIGFIACVYFIPTLSPTFDNPDYLINYTVGYSSHYGSESGKAAGRASAIDVTFNTLINNPLKFILGFGPGSMSESFFKESKGQLRDIIPIEYGISQVVVTSLESGFLGMLLFFWLFTSLLVTNQRFFNSTQDEFWKSISFSFRGIWFTFLLGCFYCAIFRSDVAAFIYWFFAAAIFTLNRQKRKYD